MKVRKITTVKYRKSSIKPPAWRLFQAHLRGKGGGGGLKKKGALLNSAKGRKALPVEKEKRKKETRVRVWPKGKCLVTKHADVKVSGQTVKT